MPPLHGGAPFQRPQQFLDGRDHRIRTPQDLPRGQPHPREPPQRHGDVTPAVALERRAVRVELEAVDLQVEHAVHSCVDAPHSGDGQLLLDDVPASREALPHEGLDAGVRAGACELDQTP